VLWQRIPFFFSVTVLGACAIDDRVLSNDGAGIGGTTAGTGGSKGTGGRLTGGGGVSTSGSGGVSSGSGGVANGGSGGTSAGAGGSAVVDAGHGGSAGSAVMRDPLVIDDLEDNDALLIPVAGRDGAWFTFNDGTATGVQTPASGASFHGVAGGYNSAYAARTYGQGFQQFGSSLAFNFRAGTPPAFYDARAYKGIRFFAKAPSGTKTVKVVINDLNTTPNGGICSICFDPFFETITLATDWSQYTVMFADMKQAGYGVPQVAALAAGSVEGVQFSLPPNVSFDFWIDNVAFVP
jgi:hypothetical protein